MTEPGGLQQVTTPATPAGDSRDVSILKQINKVNDDGSYTFGYEASDGSFKVETRDVAGNVKGTQYCIEYLKNYFKILFK